MLPWQGFFPGLYYITDKYIDNMLTIKKAHKQMTIKRKIKIKWTNLNQNFWTEDVILQIK